MEATPGDLRAYYAWHARIYDATRWSFLFGRDRLVGLVARELSEVGRPRLVEVGCGTGRNLRTLARALPQAEFVGIDLCESMLARARRAVGGLGGRVRLACEAYGPDSLPRASVDGLVFSYALSMCNPGYEQILDAARHHLRPGGLVAVVDFHSSPLAWFRAWMGVNHVRLDGQLPPALAARFRPVHDVVRAAYGGWWFHFLWLGRKP